MPGIKVATTAPDKVGKAAYIAFHTAKGDEFPTAAWDRLDPEGKRPWIEAGIAVLKESSIRVPVAIELMTLEDGLADKLIRHGYGQIGEMLPAAILAPAIPPKSVSRETRGDDGDDRDDQSA